MALVFKNLCCYDRLKSNISYTSDTKVYFRTTIASVNFCLLILVHGVGRVLYSIRSFLLRKEHSCSTCPFLILDNNPSIASYQMDGMEKNACWYHFQFSLFNFLITVIQTFSFYLS